MEIALYFSLFAAIVFLATILGSPRFKGAQGERRVSRSLRRSLDADDVRILDDLTLPARGGTTQIDHIVLSRYGVFVIETKNMTGWIFGAEDQGQWTQVLHRKKTRFQNPLRQNYGHVRTVQSVLEIGPEHVHNIVAFVGTAQPKTPMPPQVVWSTRALTSLISSYDQPVLAPDTLDALNERLTAARLAPGRRTRKAHIRRVKETLAARGTEGSGCPTCGGDMVERRSRRDGQVFLGCARYPACRGKRDAPLPSSKVLEFPSR